MVGAVRFLLRAEDFVAKVQQHGGALDRPVEGIIRLYYKLNFFA